MHQDREFCIPVSYRKQVTDKFAARPYVQPVCVMNSANCYEDRTRADAYSTLEFKNTYYLAYRDLPIILRDHVRGTKALDFGCGTGRSTRFLKEFGLEVTGVDISEDMVGKARERDPSGDYRLVPGDDFRCLTPATYDLIQCVFTFDNIAGRETKDRIFRDLRRLLKPGTGRIVHVVSRPEIYWHEWASFSTRDFPENRKACSGDTVRIIVTDHADQRPVEDVVCTDTSYREIFEGTGLVVMQKYEPLATGTEPYCWKSEMEVAPWAIYVLSRSGISNVR